MRNLIRTKTWRANSSSRLIWSPNPNIIRLRSRLGPRAWVCSTAWTCSGQFSSLGLHLWFGDTRLRKLEFGSGGWGQGQGQGRGGAEGQGAGGRLGRGAGAGGADNTKPNKQASQRSACFHRLLYDRRQKRAHLQPGVWFDLLNLQLPPWHHSKPPETAEKKGVIGCSQNVRSYKMLMKEGNKNHWCEKELWQEVVFR